MNDNPHERSNLLHREPLLLSILVVVIAGCFALTSFAAKSYHHKQKSLGEEWYQRGEAALSQARASEAVEDFRNALAYGRDNDRYRLRLAQALVADQRPQEARAHLLSLWEREPGDGTVNLELARLAAERGDVSQAQRYYHGAIYGAWPENASEHRWETRFEFSQFLLTRGTTALAQAELVALAASLPVDDATRQTRLGQLFLRAGLNERALAAFGSALHVQKNLAPALAGAGQAAFQSGDYQTAQQYLRRAVEEDRQNQQAAKLLDRAELVLRLDPFLPRLPAKERARRAAHDFQTALERLQTCLGKPEFQADPDIVALHQQGNSWKGRLRGRLLEQDPDALSEVMELAFGMEKAATRCGPASAEDEALLLIARQRETLR